MDKFDLEAFPVSKSAKRMLGYVSDGFYERSYVGKWLFQVMGMEYDRAREVMEELPAQLFPETATWGLMYHEIKWGLPVREDLPYEERRRLIYQRRDYRAPMTPYSMENYLEEVTGFEVHVADVNDPGEYGFEAPHPNVFKVYFLGEETLDVKRVFRMIDRMKQSHTTYTINERVQTRLDNSHLEQILFRNLLFQLYLAALHNQMALSIHTRFRQGFLIPEEIRLRSIQLAWQVPSGDLPGLALSLTFLFPLNFWGSRLLDGSRRLDGSKRLDGRRRYRLLLDVAQVWRGKRIPERFMRPSMAFIWEQRLPERMEADRIESRMKINFREGKPYPIRAATLLSIKVVSAGQERIGSVTVTVKTREYRFLDGSRQLDGSRNLNSVYRKEMV